MAVRDDWQGKGVGSALLKAAIDLADNWLNLTRLELEVFTDNEAAVQLYMKFDFEVKGLLREYGFRNGKYVDVYAMARNVFFRFASHPHSSVQPVLDTCKLNSKSSFGMDQPKKVVCATLLFGMSAIIIVILSNPHDFNRF